MLTDLEIYEFILENIRKVIMPEELISIDSSISRLELLALLLVQRQPDIKMSDLAQNMRVPMNTATGVVNRLVKKGLLCRGSNAEDRRVVTVFLNDNGKSLVEKLNNHFNTLIDRVRNIVTKEEFELIIKLMQKIILGLQNNGPDSNKMPVEPRRDILVE